MIVSKKIKEAVFKKPYSFYFLFFFFLYLFFNIYINKLYVTYRVLIDNLYYGIFLIFLMLAVAFLVGLNINLMILKFKEYRKLNYKSGSFATFGVFFGILGGACPGCIVGLFPAVAGIFFGIGISLNILPFKGLELQVLSIILLIVSTNLLSKNSVCKIQKN